MIGAILCFICEILGYVFLVLFLIGMFWVYADLIKHFKKKIT